MQVVMTTVECLLTGQCNFIQHVWLSLSASFQRVAVNITLALLRPLYIYIVYFAFSVAVAAVHYNILEQEAQLLLR